MNCTFSTCLTRSHFPERSCSGAVRIVEALGGADSPATVARHAYESEGSNHRGHRGYRVSQLIGSLRLSSGRDQQPDREGPTDDGRHLGEPPGAVRELAQSGAQHRPHCGSERRLPSLRGNPGSKHFDDEEWLPSVSAQSRAASSGSIVSALRSRAASVAVVASSSRSSGTVVTALSWPNASMSPTPTMARLTASNNRWR
jgi:hypothetical protein